jgi:hypothetical protein
VANRSLVIMSSLLACAAITTPALATAATLESRTVGAYDAYLEHARQRFLARANGEVGPRPQTPGVSAEPASEDGILAVPGGLVHHWVGRAYIEGVTLQDALDTSTAYSSYSHTYSSIVESQLVDQHGQTFRVRMRVKEGDVGVTAVLEVHSTIEYVGPTNGRAHALSNADEIREVRRAGRPDEYLLPAGHDSGYLWRANTLTRFVEFPGGVFVEMETIGLSRRFPPLLGWLIEPIARRLGRKSVETSLKEFLAAVDAGRSLDRRSRHRV